LLGAGDASNKVVGLALTLEIQADRDRDMAALRIAMGFDAFVLAYAEGQTMTLAQAMMSALGAFVLNNPTSTRLSAKTPPVILSRCASERWSRSWHEG